ncbi:MULTISPECIES: hypothetical protein [Streptomyces]|uniref:hypothetical protein n=1 Tax=Streptomyces TaxID=1883 RepID=UPI0019D168B1|nr:MULTISPECIES: hypothetical protein [Streptomyces]WDV33267.1 hypothetical protein OIM90_24160 [Streptomyces sp. AD16]WSB19991.1 hypothetical protein OHB02_07055 [Streptomyces albidoflavus]
MGASGGRRTKEWTRCPGRLLRGAGPCLNGLMAGYQYTTTGRCDLEPFWPSRQHHDFDRVCCRA